MPRYYISSGTKDNPLYGGWMEVDAPDRHRAISIFLLYKPRDRLRDGPFVYENIEELEKDLPYDLMGNHCCLTGRITLTYQSGKEIREQMRKAK